jgi:hypothetical protein
MISGMDRPVILDIARMAAARVAIDRLTFVGAFLFLIESMLTLSVFPDAGVNARRLVTATIGLLLIAAQIALVRPGLEHLCRNIWRAYGFFTLAVLTFIIASIAIRAGWAFTDQPDREDVATLPAYFLSLSAVLA